MSQRTLRSPNLKRKRASPGDDDDDVADSTDIGSLYHKSKKLHVADDRRAADNQDESDADHEVHRDYAIVCCTLESAQGEIATLRARVAKLTKTNEDLAEELAALNYQGPITGVPDELITVIFSSMTLFERIQSQGICKRWYKLNRDHETCLIFSMFCGSATSKIVNNHLLSYTRTTDDDVNEDFDGTESLIASKEIVTRVDPAPFGGLMHNYRNLRSLSLARCLEVGKGVLTNIAIALPRLVELDLFSCRIDDFTELKHLPHLRRLRVGDYIKIVDASLRTLPPQLTALKIEWCPGLQNDGLANIAHLTSLVELEFEQNDAVHSEGMILPDSLAPTLRKLSFLRQGWFLDDALASLSRMTQLDTLILYWVPIGGQGFAELTTLTNLTCLDVRRAHTMVNAGFRDMVNSLQPSIRRLSFTGVHQVDRDGMKELRKLTTLVSLNLRCGRSIIDDDEGTDFKIFDFGRLQHLSLLDAVGLTSVGIKRIVGAQPQLESLFIDGGSLLHSDDLMPIQQLTKLKNFQIRNFSHINRPASKTELDDDPNEELTIRHCPGGGVTLSFIQNQVPPTVIDDASVDMVIQVRPANPLRPLANPMPPAAQDQMGQFLQQMARQQMQLRLLNRNNAAAAAVQPIRRHVAANPLANNNGNIIPRVPFPRIAGAAPPPVLPRNNMAQLIDRVDDDEESEGDRDE